MNSRPEAWLKQAHNDLALARLAKDNGFMAQACDLASQSAEKALKGALLELGIEPPHTHVLNDLVGRLDNEGIEVTNLTHCRYGASVGWPFNRVTRWTPPRPLICLTWLMQSRRSRPPAQSSTLLPPSTLKALKDLKR